MLTLGVSALVVWALMLGANALILFGLRAPRLDYAGPLCGDFGAAREVRLPTCNQKMVTGWCVAPSCAGTSPAVVVMHGWGANASLMQGCLAPLHAAGLGVLLLDARCHGRSDGEPFTSLPRFAEDIEAGLAWLTTQPWVDPTRLAVIGHSVGAGAALLTATRHTDVRAVVSVSAFAHPYEVMRRYLASYRIPYPVLGWYVLWHVQRVIGARFDAIAPLRSMTQISIPVLLVHGRDDEMVPLGDARRLLAAGPPGQVQLLEVAGRHDLSTALEEHLPEITVFLQQALQQVSTRVDTSVSV